MDAPDDLDDDAAAEIAAALVQLARGTHTTHGIERLEHAITDIIADNPTPTEPPDRSQLWTEVERRIFSDPADAESDRQDPGVGG